MYKVARVNKNWFLLKKYQDRYGIVTISPYLSEIFSNMEDIECYDCNDKGVVWKGDYDNMVEVKCHCKL